VAAINARATNDTLSLVPSRPVLEALCEGEASAPVSFTESLEIATQRDVYLAKALAGQFEIVRVEPPHDAARIDVGDEWSLPFMRVTCRVTRPVVVANANVTLRLTSQPERTAEMLLPLAHVDDRWFLAGDFGTLDESESALRAYLPKAEPKREPSAEEREALAREAHNRAVDAARADTERVFARAEARCREVVQKLNRFLAADQQMGDADVKGCVKMSQADYTCLDAANTLDEAKTCRQESTEAQCNRLYKQLLQLATEPADKARYTPGRDGWEQTIEACERLTSTAEMKCKMTATTLQQTYDCADSMHKLP